MLKRKFDYMPFYDNYGVVFDAERYTVDEAINIVKEDYGYENARDIDFEVYEIRVKWFPRMDKDDMWFYDVYDINDNRGIYKVVDDENVHMDPDNKGFKCWRIRYDEAHEEVEYENSKK